MKITRKIANIIILRKFAFVQSLEGGYLLPNMFINKYSRLFLGISLIFYKISRFWKDLNKF